MKTLAEIAIEAGLVTKATAARAGHIAEDRALPLVVVLVRELGVDEVALVAALRKHTRVPLADPGELHIDGDAARQVSQAVCTRLRVVPIALTNEGDSRVLKIAMADPTDSAAIAELEQLTHCEIDVIALPLSAVEELVARLYRQMTTAIINRSGVPTSRLMVPNVPRAIEEAEISVTTQIPMSALHASRGASELEELEHRLTGLVQLLVAKGVLGEDELAELMRRPRRPPTGTDAAAQPIASEPTEDV